MSVDDALGAAAVRAAREVVSNEVSGATYSIPEAPEFGELRGVFVTLNTYPTGELRGCIGYPYPIMPLGVALEGAARSACHDPRFPDLRSSELDGITVEVTVLTPPEDVEFSGPADLLKKIEIGRDGLIIECRGRRGLLLPQVPVEWGWDAEEYLANLAYKAGLPPSAWMWDGARIQSFRGEVFSEPSPGAEATRRDDTHGY